MQAPPTATESAVIIAVPAVESAVGEHRRRFDRAASWGVPAHVTVLYPFLPPEQLDDGAITLLADAVATVGAFEATLTTTGWFGNEVLWLSPNPASPFRSLTTAVAQAFPEYQPYRGVFEEVVPHLTVGDSGSPEQLRAVERAVRPLLPISMRVREVQVISGSSSPASWRPITTLPLAPGPRAGG
jgi:2'-5' RNA ligase